MIIPLLLLIVSTQSHGFLHTAPIIGKIHSGRALKISRGLVPSSPLSATNSAEEEKERLVAQAGDEGIRRTQEQLSKLNNDGSVDSSQSPEYRELYGGYIRESANTIKKRLSDLKLNSRGRKPDLVKRLVEYELFPKQRTYFRDDKEKFSVKEDELLKKQKSEDDEVAEGAVRVTEFAGLKLSPSASNSLTRAQFVAPTATQEAVIPVIGRGEDCIIHAETGSGKTLAYLLPILEDRSKEGIRLILTPTRELACQVASIAMELYGSDSVRLVTNPTNLMEGDGFKRGDFDSVVSSRDNKGMVVVGSAKAVMVSLYGDGKMPAPPTPKPAAKAFLKRVQWLVLDEVDRLLNVNKGRTAKTKKHEKPAAILAASITRQTLGSCQIISASATVGRPLRRELSRVLGLSAQESPAVVRPILSTSQQEQQALLDEKGITRIITIPPRVTNYVYGCEGTTSGQLLTSAAYCIQSLENLQSKTILLVLSKNCAVSVNNAVGALKHFDVHPDPKSLMDALEAQEVSDNNRLLKVYREVTGSVGVGQSSSALEAADGKDNSKEGYLLVTGEDSIRGLHLDDLDLVIVVGRPVGPDEYIHIAGRTGRAGREGKVLTVVSAEQAGALMAWEKMLGVDFVRLEKNDLNVL